MTMILLPTFRRCVAGCHPAVLSITPWAWQCSLMGWTCSWCSAASSCTCTATAQVPQAEDHYPVASRFASFHILPISTSTSFWCQVSMQPQTSVLACQKAAAVIQSVFRGVRNGNCMAVIRLLWKEELLTLVLLFTERKREGKKKGIIMPAELCLVSSWWKKRMKSSRQMLV